MATRNDKDLNEMVGKKFGKLTVIQVLPSTRMCGGGRHASYRSFVRCMCDCGKQVEAIATRVKKGKLRSCGCLIIEKIREASITHGVRHEPEYTVRSCMKDRCYNPNNPGFKNYGGRGISICKEWLFDAGAFVKWAKNNGWRKGLDIDRIDNNGNYEPSNCRIVSRKVNSNNRRNSKLYTYKNEKKSITEWCQELKLVYQTVRGRIIRGVPFEKAVETPRVRYCRGGLVILFLLSISLSSMCQKIPIRQYEKVKFNKYIPSLSFVFMAGVANGLRDCSLFYHIKNGGFFDGRTSYKRKYKNGDYRQGEAFPLSTSVLVGFTDNVHFAPMMANQCDAWAALMMPVDENKRFSHLLLKVAALTVIRSAGHYLMYDVIIPNNNR